MTSAEIDAAMRDRLPVVYDGVRYDRIQEYVAWYDERNRRRLSVVLLARNCTVRVPANKVELAERR